MMWGVMVDSNVLLDVMAEASTWFVWSSRALTRIFHTEYEICGIMNRESRVANCLCFFVLPVQQEYGAPVLCSTRKIISPY